MPTTQEVLDELQALGSEQTRATMRRHGVPEPLYGVTFGDLAGLRKRIKTNQALAQELWATGVHEARLLATMVADPRLIDQALLDQWSADLRGHVLADAFAGLVGYSPAARDCMERWIDVDDEWIGRVGWHLLSRLALNNSDLPPAYFEPYLLRIQQIIHSQKNRIKEAMNNALIAIGTRGSELESQALRVASAIGKVEVDHGQTHCKTPDARAYILKVRTRKEQKQAVTVDT
jgi:3-methyladenine DNA glycosylase AlkD